MIDTSTFTHVIASGGLVLLGWRISRSLEAGIALVLLAGIMLEAVQHAYLGGEASFSDMLANLMGVLLASAVVAAIRSNRGAIRSASLERVPGKHRRDTEARIPTITAIALGLVGIRVRRPAPPARSPAVAPVASVIPTVIQVRRVPPPKRPRLAARFERLMRAA